jgi:hypothetical protein
MTKKISEYFMAYEARKVFAIRKMKTQFTNKNRHILRTDILQKQTEACGAVERSFLLGGGGGAAEIEGQRPEEIFKFRVSELPFPGLWGNF